MQNWENLLSESIVNLISALTGGFAGWFFTRKKSEIEMVDQAAGIWRELSKELEAKVKDMREELERLSKSMSALEGENAKLRIENKRLEKLVDTLTKRVKGFEAKHGE